MSQIQLSPQSKATIQHRVSSGLNASEEEVINEALAMLADQEQESQERLTLLRQAIQEGFDSGEGTPWDPNEVEQLARQMRENGEFE